MKHMHVKTLILMAGLHFVVMYILMYAMVNDIANVYFNLNQLYMAGIMTTPMVLIEVTLMYKMYENKKALLIISGISAALFVLLFVSIRGQIAISDKEFIRSMVPHHAGAILMCEKATIEDTEIRELCEQIINTQQEEIDQMKVILDRLNY